LDLLDWEYLFTLFFETYKNCNIFHCNFQKLLTLVFTSKNQSTLNQFQQLEFYHDLILNYQSRFANRPFVIAILKMINNEIRNDSRFWENTCNDFDEIIRDIDHKDRLLSFTKRFSVPEKSSGSGNAVKAEEFDEPPLQDCNIFVTRMM
jgi:hypothetical protein